jgi:signal transduction histidine kinase
MTPLGPLRRRLLWHYLLTVGLLLLAAEGGIYLLVRWAGERELDTQLRKEVEWLAAAVEWEGPGTKLDGKKTLERTQERSPVSWQVLYAKGGTVARSRQHGQDDLPAVGGPDAPPNEVVLDDMDLGSGRVRAARLCVTRDRKANLPFPDFGPPWKKGKKDGWKEKGWKKKDFWKAVAYPDKMAFDIRAVVNRGPLDAQLASLGGGLLAAFPVLLGLAAVSGLFLIRRALRPVALAFDRERRFTGAASHELRTPLTALRAEIELTLRRERTVPEYIESLARMERLAGRMTGLVEGLLVLARARAGHLLMGASEVSVAGLSQAIDEVVRLLPGRERVAVEACEDEAHVLGDGLLLALAVRNLVENALVHTASATVAVRLEVPAKQTLRVIVADRGPGLPEEILRKYEGGGPSAGQPEGKTGLGLAITQVVVEAHRGRLELRNRPGEGAEAVIALPLARAS